MPRGRCHRHNHSGGTPCSCEMGNLYRFCEPIVLICLARIGAAYGYQLLAEAEQLAVTHAGLDSAVIYRVLRRLEGNGCVTSSWEESEDGPSRRVYQLTPRGQEHLAEWAVVLEAVSSSVTSLARDSRRLSPVARRVTGNDTRRR